MISNINYPQILFLRGCFLSDCDSIEDIFDEKLVSESNLYNKEISINNIKYNKIPSYFTDTNTWIKKTNIKCWFCGCTFFDQPIFIPNNIQKITDSKKIINKIDVIGNFCSWNCAASYIHLHYNSKKWEMLQLLKILYKIFNGVAIDHIVPAPPKTLMKQYGGDLTILEYKNKIKELNDNYKKSVQHNLISSVERV